MALQAEATVEAVQTVHELLHVQATQKPDAPFISYPAFGPHYTTFTNRQIQQLTVRVAKKYRETPQLPVQSASEEKVVALLGVSNLSYIVSVLALSRLGFTVLLLSTKITDAAYAHLFEKTGCEAVFVQPAFEAAMARVVEEARSKNLRVFSIADLPLTADSSEDGISEPDVVDPVNISADRAVWIIHSSGSTGLPKPIRQSHRSVLNSCKGMARGKEGQPIYTSLPFNHAYGALAVISALCAGSNITLHNADLPLTSQSMLAAFKYLQPAIVHGVPYAIKILSSTEEGLDALKKCKGVGFGGSSCPEPMGDKLVSEGVNFFSLYGSTECGVMMTSIRDYANDRDWNYLRPLPHFVPFAHWSHVADNLYELIVRPDWPSKSYTNREDGSYATSDLFEKHPTDENKWKYMGRYDDTIVLNNGEKANPIPIELAVRQSPLVRDVVVVGAERPFMAMLIVANDGVDLPKEEFIDAIWEQINLGNQQVPTYAKIEREAIEILPASTTYPMTDKGTAIRARFIQQFSDLINELYGRLEGANTDYNSGLELSLEELKEYLRKALLAVLDLEDPTTLSDDADFFTMGLDSLGTMSLWRKLVRNLNTGGHPIGQNIAFEKPTINSLARHLYSLRTGEQVQEQSAIEVMQGLIKKYSDFRPHAPRDVTVDGEYILLTGATGSLGAHVAAQLVAKSNVRKVYCLVRTSDGSQQAATDRVTQALKERELYNSLSAEQLEKLVCLSTDLSQETLGLAADDYENLLATVAVVMHCGWQVNFNMDVTSFEKHNIRGTYNLIKFCLKSPHKTPPSFNFCSSISTVLASSQSTIPETLPPNLELALPMGYAQSKLVSEYICSAAARETGLAARVHRIGQIVGDTKHGIWNASEAIGLTVQSAKIIKALPVVPGDEDLSWLPVDVCAATIIDLSLLDNTGGDVKDPPALDAVFGVCHPKLIKWNADFLPALKDAGLEFDAVDQREWIEKLRQSPRDPKVNPPVKLLAFFEQKYDKDTADHTPYFQTEVSCRYSQSLRAAAPPDSALVAKTLRYWEEKCW